VRIQTIGSTVFYCQNDRAKPTVDILVETTQECWTELKTGASRRILSMLENSRQISFNKGYTETGFAGKVYHCIYGERGT
jgi:transcription initiation factor IIE alpha subunit